jgi:hypothetical protein
MCDDCPLDPENDADQDEICGDADPFPYDPNNDEDHDEFGANEDNCPTIYNEDQLDYDGDDVGDVCDVCMYDPLNDADNDALCGDIDYITGISSSINTTFDCVEVLIDGQADRVNYEGTANVVVNDCNGTTLAEFDFEFGPNGTLDLMNTLLSYDTNGTNKFIVSGIDLENQNATKTIYMDIVMETGTLCIIDQEVTEIVVRDDCANGVKLACDGTSGQYTCEKIINNTKYKISGLKHSAVAEYSYTAPETPPSGGGGSSGGGGGGGFFILPKNETEETENNVTVTSAETEEEETESEEQLGDVIESSEIDEDEGLGAITGAAVTEIPLWYSIDSKTLIAIIIIVIALILLIGGEMAIKKHFDKKKSPKKRGVKK